MNEFTVTIKCTLESWEVIGVSPKYFFRDFKNKAARTKWLAQTVFGQVWFIYVFLNKEDAAEFLASIPEWVLSVSCVTYEKQKN